MASDILDGVARLELSSLSSPQPSYPSEPAINQPAPAIELVSKPAAFPDRKWPKRFRLSACEDVRYMRGDFKRILKGSVIFRGRELGKGAQGNVFTAWVRKNKEAIPDFCPVVVKLQILGVSRKPGDTGTLLREYQSRQLAGPAETLVDFFCYCTRGFDGGTVEMILMERGLGSLLELNRLGIILSSRTRAKVMKDVGNGLLKLQESGQIHGDVKFGNIIVYREGPTKDVVFKLADFGMTDTIDEECHRAEGTRLFMPPEMLLARARKILKLADPLPGEFPGNGTTDIWALGVVLHCLLPKQLARELSYPFKPPEALMTRGALSTEKLLALYKTLQEEIEEKKSTFKVDWAGEVLSAIFDLNPLERPSIEDVLAHLPEDKALQTCSRVSQKRRDHYRMSKIRFCEIQSGDKVVRLDQNEYEEVLNCGQDLRGLKVVAHRVSKNKYLCLASPWKCQAILEERDDEKHFVTSNHLKDPHGHALQCGIILDRH